MAFHTPVRDYPPLADRKASALLAANGLMVSVLVGQAGRIGAILEGPSPWASALLLAILGPISGLILVGSWAAFHVLTRPAPPLPGSLAAFPAIAALPLADYIGRMKDQDFRRAVTAMLHYNHAIAVLSVVKFRLVERSLRCARLTFVLWMLLILIFVLVP